MSWTRLTWTRLTWTRLTWTRLTWTRRLLTVALVGGLAACSGHGSAGERAGVSPMAVAPYLYSWGDRPDPVAIMRATGVSWFTLAFILADNGQCAPAWDGDRPLTGGADAALINSIRAAGGDVVVSFGGESGDKLALACDSAEDLAATYQQVIDAYQLKAIDLDIEADELRDADAQDRILGAVTLVKAANPGLVTIVTTASDADGPGRWAQRLITQAAAVGAGIDVFTIMPFDIDADADMYDTMVTATQGLQGDLSDAFGWDQATAYQHIGVSGMNGLTDVGERVSTDIWTRFTTWAAQHNLARLSFWAVNRDRPCPTDTAEAQDSCSGVDQTDWQFTAITLGYLTA